MVHQLALTQTQHSLNLWNRREVPYNGSRYRILQLALGASSQNVTLLAFCELHNMSFGVYKLRGYWIWLQLNLESSLTTCKINRRTKIRNPQSKIWPTYTYDLHPFILRTNKQAYQETYPILHDPKLMVKITSGHPRLEQICANIGLTTMPISDGGLGRCAVLIKHEVFHYINDGHMEANKSYRIAVTDVTAFCEALLLANTTSHWRSLRRTTLEVSVFDKAGESDAGKVPNFEPKLTELLDAFTILRGVFNFRIAGAVSIDLKLGVEGRVSQE